MVDRVSSRVDRGRSSRCGPTTRGITAWSSLNRPGTPGADTRILSRSRLLAISAITSGSRSPSHNASRIVRPVTPNTSPYHRGQLDLGVFQQLLQTLHLARAFLGELSSIAGHVPQLPVHGRRHEAAPNSPHSSSWPIQSASRHRSCGPARLICAGLPTRSHRRRHHRRAPTTPVSNTRRWPPSPPASPRARREPAPALASAAATARPWPRRRPRLRRL